MSLRGGRQADEAISGRKHNIAIFEIASSRFAGLAMTCLFLFLFSSPLFASEFNLTSPDFKEGEMIPKKHTCDAENVSPRLQWSTAPAQTQSFALIVEDPDATAGNWVHWVLYDLPPSINNLPGEIPALKQLANGEIQGQSDFKQLGYGGPCPPSGTHRYFFRLYALDSVLRLQPGATAKEVRAAMKGHVLDTAELMGKYQRAEPVQVNPGK